MRRQRRTASVRFDQGTARKERVHGAAVYTSDTHVQASIQKPACIKGFRLAAHPAPAGRNSTTSIEKPTPIGDQPATAIASAGLKRCGDGAARPGT
jgi:hypothetical protein